MQKTDQFIINGMAVPVLVPPPPPLCISCMSLFVNTPDSDNQLIRSALRAWTLFRLTCSLHSVHCSLHSVHCSLHSVHCSLHRVLCSLLPEQGNPLKVTSLRNIHSWNGTFFKHRRVWHHIGYLWYIQFRFTSHTLQFIWNGIYTFASNWNLGGILRIENRCTDCWMFARQISGLSDHSTHSAYSRAPAGATASVHDNGIFYQTFANVTSPLHFFLFLLMVCSINCVHFPKALPNCACKFQSLPT